MWVKICANTNLPDAQRAAELGADAVGFVFAPSKRQVTPEQVAAITPQLPAAVLTVGVFAPQEPEAILRAVERAGLRGVQLHGSYDPDLVDALHRGSGGRLALIQVIGIEVEATGRPETPQQQLAAALEAALADERLYAVLLDAARAGASGGLGQSFAWQPVAAGLRSIRQRAAERVSASGGPFPKLFLAGGLRPENVREAIRILQPDGVDVASGVEATPGRKDPHRLAAFLAAARSTP